METTNEPTPQTENANTICVTTEDLLNLVEPYNIDDLKTLSSFRTDLVLYAHLITEHFKKENVRGGEDDARVYTERLQILSLVLDAMCNPTNENTPFKIFSLACMVKDGKKVEFYVTTNKAL